MSVSNSGNCKGKKMRRISSPTNPNSRMVITDEEIIIKVLESIDEYYSEGKAQNICVFGSEYYKKADTLILSARIGGEIIETVEVDLRTLKVVQCHGKYNQDTEYHERIIDLVNKNANLIRERMKAA
mgnify:CR=1 FL=1